ncbi:hypothetical protein Tco_1332377 [Tanacetum coccineum]
MDLINSITGSDEEGRSRQRILTFAAKRYASAIERNPDDYDALYIVNNIAFNISIINLVKISSAVVSSLVVVLSVQDCYRSEYAYMLVTFILTELLILLSVPTRGVIGSGYRVVLSGYQDPVITSLHTIDHEIELEMRKRDELF